MMVGLVLLSYVIQTAVTKGINNSIIGKLLEGKDENISMEELLAKYGAIDKNKKG